MPKDLIQVGQRGVAIIDSNTPQNIKGFCTYDIEDCIGFYVAGNSFEKHALMHIDRQTSAESIAQFVTENFSVINDYRVFFNPLVAQKEEWMEIAGVNLEKLDSIPTNLFRRDAAKSERLPNGAVEVALDRRNKSAAFFTNRTLSELQERHTYDRDFEEYRKKTHYINGIFGNSVIYDNEFPIDLQFSGTTYTKVPPLLEAGLAEDLELLKGQNQAYIVNWLFEDHTMEKYPHLHPLKTSHGHLAPLFANDIMNYFRLRELCDLTEYKIPLPLNDPEREKRITDLASTIGEEAEISKHRTSDWSEIYCSVKLKSDSLKKDVRESMGLDRLKIIKPSKEQAEDLIDQLPLHVIEKDKTNPAKVLITFTQSEENRKIIKNIVEPNTISQTTNDTRSQSLLGMSAQGQSQLR